MAKQHMLHIPDDLLQIGKEQARKECKETGEPVTWQKWWRQMMYELAAAQDWFKEK